MRSVMLQGAMSGKKAKTSHALVANELGRAIVTGIHPEGSLLPGDQELAARFKVSRTVLREAMKTLAAKGLVVPRARIGTRVTPRSQWNLFDPDILSWIIQTGIDESFLVTLTEMRLAFEPFAARLAAEKASEADIARLYGLVDDMARADHTAESLASADLKFHLGIMEASGNPFMRTVGNLVEAALVSIFKLSAPLEAGEKPVEVAGVHRRIVDAIAAHDADGAMNAMQTVILAGRDNVKLRLSTGG